VTGIRTDGGRVTGVETGDGVVATDCVVCTAGAWSREVAAMAGVDLPVTPVLRPIWYTEPVPNLPTGLPMTVDFSTGFYFHPEGPGLLFGMADPDQPPGFDQRMRDDWLERVGEVMERRAPAMLEMGVAGGWTGFYEVSPDHNALIGRADEVEGFVYGTGFSGHGFLQSPAVGEILRDLVLRTAPFVDVAPLSASRFRRAEIRRERAIV
jgi:sarcosine oxidase subunit beta